MSHLSMGWIPALKHGKPTLNDFFHSYLGISRHGDCEIDHLKGNRFLRTGEDK